MQSLEFKTELTNGTIHLPPNYRHWQEGKTVKIIIKPAATIQAKDLQKVFSQLPTLDEDLEQFASDIDSVKAQLKTEFPIWD